MTTRIKVLLFSLAAVFMILVAATPTHVQPVSAAPRPTRTPKTIIVEVTEQQFIKAFGRIRFFSDMQKLTLDVIDGQTVVLIDVDRAEGARVLFHFGVFVEKNKLAIRAGSFEGDGVTEPIEETYKRYPEGKPPVLRMEKILTTTARNQIARKVGGRYTIQSAVFTQDKLVITILK
jgi:hypothetical protein